MIGWTTHASMDVLRFFIPLPFTSFPQYCYILYSQPSLYPIQCGWQHSLMEYVMDQVLGEASMDFTDPSSLVMWPLGFGHHWSLLMPPSTIWQPCWKVHMEERPSSKTYLPFEYSLHDTNSRMSWNLLHTFRSLPPRSMALHTEMWENGWHCLLQYIEGWCARVPDYWYSSR